MSVYRYQVNKCTYDVFTKSQSKAKHYLQAIGLRNPQFICKNPTGDVSNVVGVKVPDDYITPKQHALKYYREQRKLGNITEEDYLKDTKIIKETW